MYAKPSPRWLRLSGTYLLAFYGCTVGHPGEVQRLMDHHSQVTIVALSDMMVRGPAWDDVFHVSMSADIEDNYASVDVRTFVDSWSRCQTLDFVADGVVIPVVALRYHGSAFSSGREEILSGVIPASGIYAMSTARRLEGRWCADVFSMSADHVAVIHRFARMTWPTGNAI